MKCNASHKNKVYVLKFTAETMHDNFQLGRLCERVTDCIIERSDSELSLSIDVNQVFSLLDGKININPSMRPGVVA